MTTVFMKIAMIFGLAVVTMGQTYPITRNYPQDLPPIPDTPQPTLYPFYSLHPATRVAKKRRRHAYLPPKSTIIEDRLRKENRLLRRILRLSYLMRLTSYTAGDPAQGTGTRTALGTLAGYGQVAVDPQIIPLGTYLWIPGYGIARATDTGGAVKGAHIDLCFGRGYSAYRAALRWGTRIATIYIVPREALPLFT